MTKFLTLFVLVAAFVFTSNANAKINSYRWTNQPNLSDSIQSILVQLNKESGLNLSSADFQTFEHRDMADFRFTTFLQTYQGIPIKGAMIRTWVDLKTGELSQMEAHLEDGQTTGQRTSSLRQRSFSNINLLTAMKSLSTMKYVRAVVLKDHDDKFIGNVKTREQWDGQDLQRVIEVQGRHGTHVIVVSHLTQKIVSSTYVPFPNADVSALVYPIYEETEVGHKIQERIPVTLKNLLNERKKISSDPYEVLRNRHYLYSKMDPVLGETPDGQAQGYWSFSWLMNASRVLYEGLPWEDNSYANGGLYLEGKYATVSLHPDVLKLKGIQFPLLYSGHLKFLETETADGDGEVAPMGAFRGQLITDPSNALARPARRLPDHDMLSYINDGFDEIQVYYAIDRLMESLHNMGFTDPELSTRAFNAFLYDPDISMKDNAYYMNDTINFTTYSPDAQNFARDNSTIWHELGHGVMDRLMGDMITLADTGGLSEGMADFVAQLVIEDVTDGKPFDGKNDFRIVNQTGFSLTNEVHDDGEAYGGTMRDIMEASIQKFGRAGLTKMTDLTLDTMRLTRNHPGLTANDWFEHMMFADELGKAGVRAPGEMKSLILSSLALRNFNLDNSPTADFKIVVDSKDVLTGSTLGSRENPYRVDLKPDQVATHQLDISLKSTAGYKFTYPVKIEVNYTGGALEGAVRWADEAAGPKVYTLNSEADTVSLKLSATGVCDFINRPDGTCSDYVYIKVYKAGETRSSAKKRFYMRVNPIQ